MPDFKVGDAVWFVTKYGHTATGTFQGHSKIPSLKGDVEGYDVLTKDGFGPGMHDDKGFTAFVPKGKLNKGVPNGR